MDDYDEFVQHRLSQLRKDEEEHDKSSPASSVIRFYGKPILPPLLSGERRGEMQRHRDAAQKAAVHRKFKDDARLAYVQTILQSVQLRKTPTLEELLQESEMNTESAHSLNTSDGSVLQSAYFIETNDNLLLSPLPGSKEKDSVPPPPFTSTTYSAFFTSNVTTQQRSQEGSLNNQDYSQQWSQPSSLNGARHQTVSSGYATYENVENTASVSAGSTSHCFGSSECGFNTGGFFLHNTSNTIAKMPDIISHPPVDGEELERSGVESSLCPDFITVKDISCSSPQEDSAACDHFPVDKCENMCHAESTEAEDNVPVTTVPDLDKDHILNKTEGLVSSSQNDLESSRTLNTHPCPNMELHIQDDVDEAEPSEEPYRLSLQALLKKSQEYRRRQRMLRNQAKTIKIQEKAQEKARAEECSLSDKENDEFPSKSTVTPEGKKTKERRGTVIPSAETSPKESWEKERAMEKSGSTQSTGAANTQEMISVEDETTIKNNKLNISQEVIKGPKQIGAFTRQVTILTETSPVQKAFYLSTCSTAFHKGVRRYHTIPAPNFCRSPVHCKSKGTVQDEEVAREADMSKRNVSPNTGLNNEHKVEESELRHQNRHQVVPSTVSLPVAGAAAKVSASTSQHIDQLESNLSGLKELISDLESTLTENLGNHSQSEVSFESVKNFEQIKSDLDMQLRQSDGDYWENKLRDDAVGNDAQQHQMYGEWPRRLSLDSFKNVDEDTASELSICNTDDAEAAKASEAADLSEVRLVKTLATERAKETAHCKEGLAKSCGEHGGCRKQQPAAKCILSVAQRQRIPDIFRNAPSETAAQRIVSVLSDTSNHPLERRNNTPTEGHNLSSLPSLNQSYDVDAPSGLWFLEGSGSDSKHLIPESGVDGQGGVSKVKRRLLMPGTGGTQERRADANKGAGRPNSSTPRAALLWQEGGSKEKQEQLKESHAAQVRALQEEHRRQREELLQALAARYHLLQTASFPCSMSSSRLVDTLTFSQPSSPLSERCRPLLLAGVKGFLTRRLLKTERVAQLARTIRDTQQFLQALRQPSPGSEALCSREDLLLQERVSLQLRAARYEVSDVFFNLSAAERMQLISWDRELVQERELRRQSGNTGRPRGRSSLSAATKKSLERKREKMIQKKAAERHRGVVPRTGHKAGSPETKRGQFRANPQRVPKSTYSSRPR